MMVSYRPISLNQLVLVALSFLIFLVIVHNGFAWMEQPVGFIQLPLEFHRVVFLVPFFSFFILLICSMLL